MVNARSRLSKVLEFAAGDDWLACVPGSDHARSIENNFGISAVEYNKLYDAQGRKCAICDKRCKTGKRLAVDHCHSTGKVRGLLCARCNTALGSFGDDIGRLARAIYYLSK